MSPYSTYGKVIGREQLTNSLPGETWITKQLFWWSSTSQERAELVAACGAIYSPWWIYRHPANYAFHKSLEMLVIHHADEDYVERTQWSHAELKEMSENDSWDAITGWERCTDNREKDELRKSVTKWMNYCERKWKGPNSAHS